MTMRGRVPIVLAVIGALLVPNASSVSTLNAATARFVTEDLWFEADDGVVLHGVIGGFDRISKRPLIVENGPYGEDCCNTFAGPAYNYIKLQWRGTGQSGGSLSSTGSRDQKDYSQFLGWACKQPWSDGRIGLYGFSASAIVAYNTMHRPMPCVKGAALMSGTVDLYRDLLYIGGINNTIPGIVVLAGIGGPWLGNLPSNAQRPNTLSDGFNGYIEAPMNTRNHPTQDAYWLDRTFRGNRNRIPILAAGGFYDVEARGAFEAYRANRKYGSHLLVMGAHDGWPKTTEGPFPAYARWLDRHVRGIDNGIDHEPRVRLLLSDGGHRELTEGRYTELSGTDWPLPGTRFSRYYLSPAMSGTAMSPNDGTLTRTTGAAAAQTHLSTPSDGFATDPHTTATVSRGFGSLEPLMTDLRPVEPASLTYTAPPFRTAMNVVGPASLDIFVSSLTPRTDLIAVLADVWPDGSSHPIGSGQLRTSFPDIERSRSLIDRVTGDLVQPYNVYSSESPAEIGITREYHVEILPLGNHFAKGHSLRLYIVGPSASMSGAGPGVNTVYLGGKTPSRLLLPTAG